MNSAMLKAKSAVLRAAPKTPIGTVFDIKPGLERDAVSNSFEQGIPQEPRVAGLAVIQLQEKVSHYLMVQARSKSFSC